MAKEIELKIDGEGVSPETVQWRDLREIVNGVHSAIIETAGRSGVPKNDIHVSLSRIEDRCDAAILSTSNRVHRSSQDLIHAIKTRDERGISPRARDGLESTWRRLRSRNWSMSMSRNGSHKSRAVILPDVELFEPVADEVVGNTSLLAEVVRVGGKDPTAMLLIGSDKFTARVDSREIAAQLASRLYQTIQITAQVHWSRKTREIRRIKITGLGRYCLEEADPVGALREIGRITAGSWDAVNVSDFINEIR